MVFQLQIYQKWYTRQSYTWLAGYW
jgi:hypothetical protein